MQRTFPFWFCTVIAACRDESWRLMNDCRSYPSHDEPLLQSNQDARCMCTTTRGRRQPPADPNFPTVRVPHGLIATWSDYPTVLFPHGLGLPRLQTTVGTRTATRIYD